MSISNNQDLCQLICHGADCFSRGDQEAGNKDFSEVQPTPLPALFRACKEVMLGSIQTGNVYAPYFSSRLLRAALIRDWATTCRPSNGSSDAGGGGQEVVDFLEQYLGNNAVWLLTAAANSGLLSELSDTWACVWKLRWVDLTSSSSEGESSNNNNGLGDAVGVLLGGMARALLHVARVEQMLSGGGDNAAALATVGKTLISRVVEEFGVYHPRSQGKGLTQQQHEECRQDFADHALLHLFTQSITDLDTLNATANGGGGYCGEGLAQVCGASIKAVHTMLCWRFESYGSMGCYAAPADIKEDVTGAPTILRVPELWKIPLLNLAYTLPSLGSGRVRKEDVSPGPCCLPNVAQCNSRSGGGGVGGGLPQLLGDFFELFAEKDNKIQTLCLDSLLQLCQVYPTPEQWDEKEISGLAEMLWEALFRLTKSVLLTYHTANKNSARGVDQSAAGAEGLEKCCLAIDRLCSTDAFSGSGGIFVHPQLADHFIGPLMVLTQTLVMQFIKAEDKQAKSEVDDESETLLREAMDHLLQAWRSLVEEGLINITNRAKFHGTETGTAIAEAAMTVFRVFVNAKIQQSASNTSGGDAEGEETSHSEEYSRSHIELVSTLGREKPDHSLPMLNNHLVQLCGHLFQGLRHSASPSPPSPQLFEALWYVLMTCGYLIGDTDEGQRPTIPTCMQEYTLEVEDQYIVPEFGEGNEDHPDALKLFASKHSLIQLMVTVQSLASELLPFLTQEGLISPAVLQAIMFVFHRYTATYLFPDLDMVEIGPGLQRAFNSGIDFADCSIGFATRSLATHFTEVELVNEGCLLLQAHVRKSTDFDEWVTQQPMFGTLLAMVESGSGSVRLPREQRRLLMMVVVGLCPDEKLAELVNTRLVPALRQVLDPSQGSQGSEGRQSDVVDSVAVLRGLIQAITSQSRLEVIYPSVGELLRLVSNNCAEPTFSTKLLLKETLKTLTAIVVDVGMLLSANYYYQLVTDSLGLVSAVSTAMEDAFARLHGLAGEDLKSAEEDEIVMVLAAAAKLVFNIATFSLFDEEDMFDHNNGNNNNSSSRESQVSGLCVQGLLMVMRFSTRNNHLSIPALREPVFALLREVASSHTKQLFCLGDADAEYVVGAVKFAVQCGEAEVVKEGLGAIAAMTDYTLRYNSEEKVNLLLQSFLQLVSELCAEPGLDPTLVPTVASAVFNLTRYFGVDATVTCFRGVFERKSTTSTLAQAFFAMEGLLRSTNYTTNARGAKNEFGSKMEEVLALVKGSRLW